MAPAGHQGLRRRPRPLLYVAHPHTAGRSARRVPERPSDITPGRRYVTLLRRAGRPLVYVTFGTVFNQDLTTITTVVEGVRELDIDVLVTLGPGTDPAGLGAQPDNVNVRDYVPQEETLARAVAVVSHAGSGTFLAALAHGLPQLALPQAADQFLNAHAAASAGVAREIAPGEITAERVRAELQRVLGDRSIADTALQKRTSEACCGGVGT